MDYFLAGEWLFEISNKTDIAKSMKNKGIFLGNLAYEVAKSKTDTAKITPESNAEEIMRIYNLYINDMQSARASTGNYTDGVLGSAKSMVEINVLEDPKYHIADDKLS